MKNAKKKTIFDKILIALAVLTVSFFALSLCFSKNTSSVRGAEIIDNPFRTDYKYNEKIDMPSEVGVSYEGKTYKTRNGYIKFPDGKVFVAGEYTLNAYGNYSIIYEFEENGRISEAEHSFTVNADSYTVGNNSQYKIDTLNTDFGQGVSGLRVKLSSGESFTYNKPINVYNGGKTELISFNFPYFDPVVREALVRLTDCYDPSVFVDIQYSKPVYGETYFLVGAYGKAAFGAWNNAKGDQIVKVVNIDGEECKINEKGNMIPSNRKKERHANLGKDRYNNVTLSVDASDKDRLRFYVDTDPEKAPTSIISELNNPDIYGYEFGGFTTGEVILSVTVKSLTGSDYGEMEVASIAGLGGDALQPSVIIDTESPKLEIDTSSRVLNVMAGMEITLPKASAHDASGLSGEPKCLVYYGYGTSFESSVEIKDGKFLPKYLGTYTVIYSASDVFGNETTEKLLLNAVKEGSEGIDFSFEKIERAAAGEIVSFDNYKVNSLNKDATVIAKITQPDGKEIVLDSEKKTLLLERSGKYKVKYEFFDSLYGGEQSYEFECSDKGLCRINASKVFMPDYVIAGAEYSTEDVRAYKYGANAPERTGLKCYISYDGGEYKEADADKFVVQNASVMKIRLVCASDEKVFIESDEIKIVDVKYGTSDFDVTKYFTGDFTGSRSEDKSAYTSFDLKKTKAGAVSFINPLLLSCFNFRFSVSDRSNMGAYTIVLTDYYERNNVVRIKFGDKVTVNGKETIVSDEYFGQPIMVSYDSSKNLSIGSSTSKFDFGITSEKVLLSVEFENVTGGGEFNVYSICGQPFGYYVKSDALRPMIYAESPDGVAYIGDEITLAKPAFSDVLSPSSRLNCVVSVYRDGVLVKSTDGKTLKEVYALDEHTFKIEGFGTYLIVYKYTDGEGRANDELRMTVSVIDTVAPTIELVGYNGKPAEAALNSVISPVPYNVSDNVSEKEAIDVFIVVFNEKNVRVCATSDTFTIKKAGTYTVYVCCYDEAGNSAYVTYTLIVK